MDWKTLSTNIRLCACQELKIIFHYGFYEDKRIVNDDWKYDTLARDNVLRKRLLSGNNPILPADPRYEQDRLRLEQDIRDEKGRLLREEMERLSGAQYLWEIRKKKPFDLS